MMTTVSCTECSQTAGLIQKVCRDSLKAPFLCAAAIHASFIRRSHIANVILKLVVILV